MTEGSVWSAFINDSIFLQPIKLNFTFVEITIRDIAIKLREIFDISFDYLFTEICKHNFGKFFMKWRLT